MARETLFTTEQILAVLVKTPDTLTAVTAGLDEAQLRAAPSAGEWSIHEVLAHLRACGVVWGGHIMAILTEDKPTRKGISPPTWMRKTDYLEQDFQSALAAFNSQRADLIKVLEALTEAEWARTATIIGAGRPYEKSVQGYGDNLARHERPHVRQIERIVEGFRKGDAPKRGNKGKKKSDA